MNPPADPPLFSSMLFEQPLPLIVVCLVIAMGLTVAAMRRRKPALLAAGGVMFGLAALVSVLGVAVQTDRETLIDETRALITSATPLDAAALKQVIDPSATVRGPDGRVYVGAGDILPELEKIDGRFGDLDHRITDLAAQAFANGEGVTQFDLRTRWNDRPLLTRWRVGWRKDAAGDFKITRIDWLEHPLGVRPRDEAWR